MLFFERLNRLFPLWVTLFAMLAIVAPPLFTRYASWVEMLLVVIMFAMGLTLSKDDFVAVFKAPLPVFIGVTLQFLLMPLAALGVSRVMGLSSELLTGMVLVGATAGGAASCVMSWLAGGRVALSVSITLISTLTSVVLTPLIAWLLIGQWVEMPVGVMLIGIAQLVFMPVAIGTVVHHFLQRYIPFVEPALATLAMAAIVLIIAIVVAINTGRLASLGPLLAVAVIVHNTIGLASGYGISRLCGLDQRSARAVALEVGMQNSGLAVGLANQFINAGTALPGALFSVWHNVSGALLAGYWKWRPVADASRRKVGER